MAYNVRVIVIVVLLAALAYLLYLWSKRRDQIECPSCGARVNMYADKCPSCGHEKGESVPETDAAETAGAAEEAEDEDLGAGEDVAADVVPSEEEVEETLGDETGDDEYDKEEVDEDEYDKEEVDEDEDVDVDAAEDVVAHTCAECGSEFDSERGLNVHRGMKH